MPKQIARRAPSIASPFQRRKADLDDQKQERMRERQRARELAMAAELLGDAPAERRVTRGGAAAAVKSE